MNIAEASAAEPVLAHGPITVYRFSEEAGSPGQHAVTDFVASVYRHAFDRDGRGGLGLQRFFDQLEANDQVYAASTVRFVACRSSGEVLGHMSWIEKRAGTRLPVERDFDVGVEASRRVAEWGRLACQSPSDLPPRTVSFSVLEAILAAAERDGVERFVASITEHVSRWFTRIGIENGPIPGALYTRALWHAVWVFPASTPVKSVSLVPANSEGRVGRR
jgi:hypothetical protein